MPRIRYITVEDSMKYCENLGFQITRPTLIKKAKECGFGHQIGGKGKWLINEDKFRGFIHGKENKN